MTKELLKKFKETKTWRSLLLYFIKPIYEFIWQYLINFQGKLLYFLWFLKKRDYYELGGNNKIIIKDNNEVSSLCKQILNFADDDFIEIQRKKIIQGDTGTIGTKSAFRKKSRNCSRQFFDDLPEDFKTKLINFATSEKMISTAAKYLKIFPIIGHIKVSINIPRENEKEHGAMLWHKDDLGYKGLDFICFVNDVDDENGPFYTMKYKNPLGVFHKLKDVKINPLPGERNKVELEKFSKKYEDNEIIKLTGPSGISMFVDSISNYHRGGFCKSKYRIKLRIEYSSAEAVILGNPPKKLFYQYLDQLEIKKNLFIKFLLLKRSFIVKNLNLSEISLKIFRLLHYKE